jgi:hypothetical protein
MLARRHLLGELTEVSSGQTLRPGSLRPGPVSLVEVAHTSEQTLSASPGDLPTAEVSERMLGNTLAPGDLLFRTRGQSTHATLVLAVPAPALAVNPLLVIRVRPEWRDALLPGYLHWVLNSQGLSAAVDREARGTIIRMVGAAGLRQLPIPLPPLEVQHRINDLAALSRREAQLDEALRDRRRHFVEQVLWRCAAQDTG